jgi:imidazolonepropionase-like amidohydrolase
MNRYTASAVLLAVIRGIALLGAQGSQAPAGFFSVSQDPVALINANVINVRDGQIARGVTLVLRSGKIESIGSGQAPAGVRTIDVKGKYVLPGFIDAHTHLSDFAAARRALESGVTTVRSAGVSAYVDVGLRELSKKGVIAGPDVLAAGYHVRPRLADEAFMTDPAYSSLISGVDTADKIRQAVRMNLSHGVDWIKVLATERAGTADTDPRKQVYSEAELRAAVEEAATKGLFVEAHAHGDEGAMAAVKAGVRSIEHGTYLSEATLALMKQKGTYFVPTYTTVIDLLEPGGDYDVAALRIRGQHMLPRLKQTVQAAHRMGIKIVTGGDTGYGPNSLTRIAQEMANFVSLGFTPLEAIQSATVLNAEMLRMEKSIGILEPGFEADLVTVDGNPLENIVVLEDVLLVISNGRVVLNRLDFARPTSPTTEQKN